MILRLSLSLIKTQLTEVQHFCGREMYPKCTNYLSKSFSQGRSVSWWSGLVLCGPNYNLDTMYPLFLGGSESCVWGYRKLSPPTPISRSPTLAGALRGEYCFCVDARDVLVSFCHGVCVT